MTWARNPYAHNQPDVSDLPEIECYPSTDGRTWLFWCKYCKVVHAHNAGLGPRVSQCFYKGSPYKGGQYLLRLTRK